MGRRSLRDQRREELIAAFAKVLAERGYEGATIAAVASEADVAPGLVHHYFVNKDELLTCLLDELGARFRRRVRTDQRGEAALLAYVEGAVGLGHGADLVAARCWVGLFAEGVRNPALFSKLRRLLDAELLALERRSEGRLSPQGAGAVLAFVVGALVLGAFAPRRTAGFAAPSLRLLVQALLDRPHQG